MLMTVQWYQAKPFCTTDELHIDPIVQEDRRYEIFPERNPMGQKRSIREISSTSDAAVVVS